MSKKPTNTLCIVGEGSTIDVYKIMDNIEHTRRAIPWTPTGCAEQVQNQQKKLTLPTTQSCETPCLRLMWMPNSS